MKITPASSRQLIELGDFRIETAGDSDGEINSALRAVVYDKRRAWVQVADRVPETVAEIVFDAFTEDEYGVLEEVSVVSDGSESGSDQVGQSSLPERPK